MNFFRYLWFMLTGRMSDPDPDADAKMVYKAIQDTQNARAAIKSPGVWKDGPMPYAWQDLSDEGKGYYRDVARRLNAKGNQ